jgi:hypothetical protein
MVTARSRRDLDDCEWVVVAQVICISRFLGLLAVERSEEDGEKSLID